LILHRFSRKLALAAGVLVEVLKDVASVFRGRHGYVERLRLAFEAIMISLIDVLAFELRRHHLGAAPKKTELTEELSGVDLLRGPMASFGVSGE